MLKLSSVIGAPFRPFVRRQLVARVAHGQTGGGLLSGATYGNDLLRTSEDVQYLANQVAWVKLSSSVQPTGSYIQYLKDQFADSGDSDAFLDDQWTPDGLARNWVLQGGTSKDIESGDIASLFAADIDPLQEGLGRLSETQLRKGIGYDGAYGLGGIRAQGYRPMPGITSMKIQTAGKAGSLRYATVDFKVWNRNQLDIIDTLYLRLGYTMLLEWGNAQYYETAESVELIRDNYGTDKFFLGNTNKDVVQYDITRRVIDSNGNYDGMLGLVTNFDCSFNQEGGWDCSIKLIGLGSIMESQKINHAYTMPPDIQKAWETIKKRYFNQRKKEKDEIYNREDRIARNSSTTAYNARVTAYNNATPIRDLASLALNKFNKGANDQIKGLYEAARPVLDLVSNPNNIVPNAKDLTNKVDITISNPISNINTDKADYYIQGALYLAHLKETGFINPLTAGQSKIVLPRTVLDLITTKLATEDRRDYIAGARGSSNNDVLGILTDLLLLVSTLVINTANNVVNGADNDDTVNGISGLGGYFSSLVYLELYKRYIQYIERFGVRDLPIEALIGFGSNSLYGTVYTPEFTKGFAYRKNVLITETVGNQKDEEEVTQYLSAALENIYDENGTPLSRDYKFFDLDNAVKFITEVRKAVQNRTSDITLTVDSLTDEQFSDRTTTYLATDTEYLEVPGVDFITPAGSIVNVPKIKIKLQIQSSIPSIIRGIINSNIEALQPGAYQGFTPVARNYDDIKVEVANMSLGLGSALEAMLTVIKYDSITYYKSGLVFERSLVDLTGKFLNYGAGSLPPMAPLFKKDPGTGVYSLNVVGTNPKEVAGYPFLSGSGLSDLELLTDATSLGVKGYSTALLQDYNRQPATNPPVASLTPRERWEAVPGLNFKTLLTSYLLGKHILSSALDKPNYKNEYPVYITLGYLLFFINNQSLLYDTTRGSKVSPGINISRPMFYIDYHNVTNLCSLTPNQLTVNPEIILTKYDGSLDDYKSLFPQNVTPGDPYFLESKNQNTVSQLLPDFKLGSNNSGYTMNILLNIDYLLSLIKSTVDRDNHNNVYLQAFLENIVADINKSLGDVNAFRVGYNDAANTVQITDDQAVAPLGDEEDHLFTLQQKLLSKDKQLFEFPVFEVGSLAQNFTLQTNTSTRMSRAIAIGAQAANSGSVQSVDASTYHWLNIGLEDRMIKTKQNATQPAAPSSTTPATGQTGNKKKSKNNKKNNKKNASSTAISPAAQDDPNKIVATKFNNHIINIYTTPTSNKNQNIYRENIDTAKNFLIQGTTKAKADAENTYGSLSIPYNATITVPGIAGIIMGNAFLLPDKILPLSVRGTDEMSKFGFYVMGLDHSFDSNRWVTDIRGQMVRIREPRKRSNVSAGTSVVTGTPVSSRNTGGLETTFKASNVDNGYLARQAVEAYFGAPILDAEWDDIVALVFAESGNTQEQRGSILAVILNIARTRRQSITDSIRKPFRYQPVTGRNGKTAEQKFKDGPPDQANEELIYAAAINILPGVDKALDGFTAYSINRYGKPGAGKNNKTRTRYLAAALRGDGYILYDKPEDPAEIKKGTQNGTIFIKK